MTTDTNKLKSLGSVDSNALLCKTISAGYPAYYTTPKGDRVDIKVIKTDNINAMVRRKRKRTLPSYYYVPLRVLNQTQGMVKGAATVKPHEINIRRSPQLLSYFT